MDDLNDVLWDTAARAIDNNGNIDIEKISIARAKFLHEKGYQLSYDDEVLVLGDQFKENVSKSCHRLNDCSRSTSISLYGKTLDIDLQSNFNELFTNNQGFPDETPEKSISRQNTIMTGKLLYASINSGIDYLEVSGLGRPGRGSNHNSPYLAIDITKIGIGETDVSFTRGLPVPRTGDSVNANVELYHRELGRISKRGSEVYSKYGMSSDPQNYDSFRANRGNLETLDSWRAGELSNGEIDNDSKHLDHLHIAIK